MSTFRKIHDLVLRKRTAKDVYGKESYGPDIPFKGRWENDVREMETSDGVQLTQVGRVYYEPPLSISTGDVIGRNGEFKTVKAVQEYNNVKGNKTLMVAYFGDSVKAM